MDDNNQSQEDIIAKADALKDEGNHYFKNLQDYNKAISSYTAAINMYGSKYIYYNNRAAAYLAKQDYQNVINDCNISLNIEENVRAYSRKAAALGELGRLNEALVVVEKGLVFKPDDKPSMNIKIGLEEIKSQAERHKIKGNEELQISKDVEKAIKSYTDAISLFSSDYVYYNNRAAAYIYAKKFKEAVVDCDKSLSLKENPRALSRKAAALGEMGDVPSAMKCIDQALLLSPDDKQSLHVRSGLQQMMLQSENFLKKGQEYYQQQDYNKAIRSFSNAIMIISSRYSYYNHRAEAYIANDEPKKALVDCDKSSALEKNIDAYRLKAVALQDLNDVEKALVEVEKALDIDPTDEACLIVENELLKRKVLLDEAREQQEEEEEQQEGIKKDNKKNKNTTRRSSFDKGRKTLIQGFKKFGDTLKSKLSMDHNYEWIQEDKNIIQQQEHSRLYRKRLKQLKDEKHYIHLLLHEDQDVVKLQHEARASRKHLYLIKNEDETLLSRQFDVRKKKNERYYCQVESDDKVLVKYQKHSREIRYYQQLIKQMAIKVKQEQEEQEAKRNSAKYIQDLIKKRRQEAGLNDHTSTIPEHLLPFNEKIDLWIKQIRKKLRKDWVGMTFSIEYDQEEGLSIGFDIEDEQEMNDSYLDYKISRYMNKLIVNGLLYNKKFIKRPDKWRVLEDGNDGRNMCLRFYCHVPRSDNKRLVKMPRTVEMDIIEREESLYDYTLISRSDIIKRISRTAYLRDNRPPMISKKKLTKPDKTRRPDVKEYVNLPSVVVDEKCPGFVQLPVVDNEVYGGQERDLSRPLRSSKRVTMTKINNKKRNGRNKK